MFEMDRIFYINNWNKGNSGWYFQAREGIAGVYNSIEEAQSTLKEYIKECIECENNGGRNLKKAQHEQPAKKSGDQITFFYFRTDIRWY